MSDERDHPDDTDCGDESPPAPGLDQASFDELMALAAERNDAHAARLQAVETKSGSLVLFAAVVAGLLIGQDAAGTGPAASAAVGLVVAAAITAAVAAGFASVRFRWPQPDSARVALEALPAGERTSWLLEERAGRGEANRRRLVVWEVVLRVAILLLVAGLVTAAAGWFVRTDPKGAPDEPAAPEEARVQPAL